MRLTILVLLVFTATAAFCQSPSPPVMNPGQSWLNSMGMAQSGRDFTRPPQGWHFNGNLPRQTIILPGMGSPLPGTDAQIDPKILLRPPQSNLGEQPPGTQIAQNLYPGLELLPIQQSKAKGEPIPTTWPNLKVHQIPIAWPKLEIKPVESGATAAAPAK